MRRTATTRPRAAPLDAAVWDAIVVGCGPVGAFAACLLARHGLRTLVIEKDAAPYSAPRAVAMDDEVVRLMGLHSPHLAAWLDRHVLKCPVDIRTGPPNDPSSWSIVGPDFPKLVAASGYHDTAFFDQPSFERALRDLLAAHASTVRLQLGERVVDVRTETTGGSGTGNDTVVVETAVTGSTDDDGGSISGSAGSAGSAAGAASTGAGASAAAAAGASRRQAQYRCRYLLAADGGASFVRRHLRIPFEGTTFPDQPWLVVDVETSDPAVAAAWQAFNFICAPQRPFVHVPLPGPAGGRRYEFMLHPHESPDAMNTPPVIHRLLHSIGVPLAAVTIVRSVVYTFHAREAATWRSGRVLLLGDAAHCMPPFRGQGMCAGIRDAAAACWRVAAAVRSPHLQEALLDTYTEERRAHLRSVVAVAVTMGRLITLRNPVLAWLRNMVIGGAYHFPLTNLIFKEPFAPPSQLSIGLFDFHAPGGARQRSPVGAALGIQALPAAVATTALPADTQLQASGLRRRNKGDSGGAGVDSGSERADSIDGSSSAEDIEEVAPQLQRDMLARLGA